MLQGKGLSSDGNYIKAYLRKLVRLMFALCLSISDWNTSTSQENPAFIWQIHFCFLNIKHSLWVSKMLDLIAPAYLLFVSSYFYATYLWGKNWIQDCNLTCQRLFVTFTKVKDLIDLNSLTCHGVREAFMNECLLAWYCFCEGEVGLSDVTFH